MSVVSRQSADCGGATVDGATRRDETTRREEVCSVETYVPNVPPT
jgi:hypothetical protein